MVFYIGLTCFCSILAFVVTTNSRASLSGFNWAGGKRNVYTDDLTWMMMEDGRGNPRLAILKGAETKQEEIDLRKDVHFILYTKSNDTGYRLYVGDTNAIQQSPFNGKDPTKFLIHGFTGDSDSAVINDVKNAYLSVGRYNVIGVDWGELAGAPLYYRAKARVVPVGNYVGDMIDFLNSAGGSASSRTHLIGHSLGAHVAGMAGARASGTVARVTGLDTARPLFGDDPESSRLDPSDAAFVDVIHSCGGWLGFMSPCGHVDFYPNGGVSVQPGCGLFDVTGSCSHSKSIEFFIDTITNHSRYLAHKCSSVDNAENGECDAAATGFMGEGASSSLRGLHWMSTE